MLKKIKVKDFQSIKYAEIELGQFTVFTGPSSSGKSSTMRAAQATVRNSFNPSQVRQGAKETHVVLEFDDHTVEAIRGKSKSTYVLDGKEFTKSGRQVPEPVVESLRLQEVSELESTFSTQFDKPYLIAEPGSTASRVLGSLTNVSVLHEGLRESNRRTREANLQIKTLSASLEEANVQVESMEYLDKVLEDSTEAERNLSDIEDKATKLERINHLLDRIKDSAQTLKTLRDTLPNLDDALETSSRIGDRFEGLAELNRTVVRMVDNQARVPSWDFESVEDAEVFKKFTKLPRLIELITTINYNQDSKAVLPAVDVDVVIPTKLKEAERITALNTILSRIKDSAVSMKSNKEESIRIQDQITETQKEYDTMISDFETCPLCMTPLKNGNHSD